MLPRFSQLLLAALAACTVASALPSAEEELRDFFARDSAVKPLMNLGRRSAATSQTRHLRPTYDDEMPVTRKRDSITPPDVGQIADFDGQDPQPIRNGLGDTFLANSNHEIDEQNVDNVAAPPTDAGAYIVAAVFHPSPPPSAIQRTALTQDDVYQVLSRI